LSYKIFSFCEHGLKIGANDASGEILQSAIGNKHLFFFLGEIGANGASGQVLQYALKNWFHTNFVQKVMDLSLPIFIAVLHNENFV
jgi:hypothetical protein